MRIEIRRTCDAVPVRFPYEVVMTTRASLPSV